MSRQMLFIVLILLIILRAAAFDVLQYVVMMRGGGGHWHCFLILGLIQSSFNREHMSSAPMPTYCRYRWLIRDTDLQKFH